VPAPMVLPGGSLDGLSHDPSGAEDRHRSAIPFAEHRYIRVPLKVVPRRQPQLHPSRSPLAGSSDETRPTIRTQSTIPGVAGDRTHNISGFPAARLACVSLGHLTHLPAAPLRAPPAPYAAPPPAPRPPLPPPLPSWWRTPGGGVLGEALEPIGELVDLRGPRVEVSGCVLSKLGVSDRTQPPSGP
jgi:hypothetical protein